MENYEVNKIMDNISIDRKQAYSTLLKKNYTCKKLKMDFILSIKFR